MPSYVVTWEIDIEAATPIEAALQAKTYQLDPNAMSNVFSVVDESGTAEQIDLDGGDNQPCRDCGAYPGSADYGTVGDGFDGYCGSCADKREPAED